MGHSTIAGIGARHRAIAIDAAQPDPDLASLAPGPAASPPAPAGLLLEHERLQRELRDLRAELAATAQTAGTAEIATNVLHNVGNVLNSVNVSAGLVFSAVRASKCHGLVRAARMLQEHAHELPAFLTQDEKGRLLPSYLEQLAESLVAEQRRVLEELGRLNKSIEHVKEIVATQQSYAGHGAVVENVRIRDLIDDAVRMNAGALKRHEVSVVREVPEVPALPIDRARLLQILVNLISNAKHAMAGITSKPHRILLRVEYEPDAWLRIHVSDQGVGIPGENMPRLFTHGFSTRKGGHGFGLHSCAISSKEMGATLRAHSDGWGRGATFTLELPLQRPACDR